MSIRGASPSSCAGRPQRLRWLVALVSPCLAPLSIALYFVARGNALLLGLPLFYVFAVVPGLDAWFGESHDSPSESALPELIADPYYRRLLYLDVVLLYLSFGGTAWFVGTHEVPGWALVLFALGVGLASADAILIGTSWATSRTGLTV